MFVCFVPTDFLSLKGISQYQGHFLNKFLKYVLKNRIKISRKKSCRFKTWMDFVRQILMKLKTSSNEGLLMKVCSDSLMWLYKHCSGHYVTTQACTQISWSRVHLRWCGSLEDYTLWDCNSVISLEKFMPQSTLIVLVNSSSYFLFLHALYVHCMITIKFVCKLAL